MSGPVRPSPFDTPHRVSAHSPSQTKKFQQGRFAANTARMDAPAPRRPIVVSTTKHEEKRRLLIVKRDLHIIRNCMLALVTVAALTIGVAAGEILAPTVVAGILAL